MTGADMTKYVVASVATGAALFSIAWGAHSCGASQAAASAQAVRDDRDRIQGRADDCAEKLRVAERQQTASNADGAEAPPAERVYTSPGGTTSLFDDDLHISLVAVVNEGDPARYKAFATVTSPGHEARTIARKDVGYSLIYQGQGQYEILITDVNYSRAWFLVSRLPNEEGRVPRRDAGNQDVGEQHGDAAAAN